MYSSPKIERAYLFAKERHEGQVRKYTGLPYIIHPVEVASFVSLVSSDEKMIMAALLHDVVEDTDTKLYEIARMFGMTVANLVGELTKISIPSDGNRAVRKEIDRQHTASACADAKTIKLADVICNTRSVVEEDSKFARVYLPEKIELLKVLTEGDIILYRVALSVIQEGFRKLKREKIL